MSCLDESQQSFEEESAAAFFPGLVLVYQSYKIRVGSFLNKGTFGEVFSVNINESKRRFAMKTIPLISEHSFESMAQEIKIINLLHQNKSHKHNIVRFELAFEHEHEEVKHACLVMERLGSSMSEFLQYRDYQPFPLEEVKAVGKQMLEALKHLHKLGIVHADVKPSNILCVLLTNDLQVKLADFGNSEMVEDLKLIKEPIQSLGFRAPEVLLGLPLDETIDIFSLGAVLAEIYSGKQLFPSIDDLQLARFHYELIGTPCNAMQGIYFEKLYRVDTRTAKPVPRAGEEADLRQYQMKRVADICNHGRRENRPKQSQRFVEALEELLSVDQYSRPTAKEALRFPFFKK